MLVDFYHLAASPLERVLPSICEKVLASGERLLLVADEDRLTQLDELLWTYSKDSFLPHGPRSRPNPEAQPILLSDAAEPLNAATNVALADGRWRDEAFDFYRAFYLFNAAQLEPARRVWRTLQGKAETEARFWKQGERGRWSRKS